MGFLDGFLGKNRAPSKGRKMTVDELRAVITEEGERTESDRKSQLKYVEIGDEYISIDDTEKINKILGRD